MKDIKIDAVILQITHGDFRDNDQEYGRDYEGLIINTNKGDIKIGITNFQECCESWGYKIDFNPHVVSKLGEDKALQYYQNKHIDKITIDFEEDSDHCFVSICFEKSEKIIMEMFNKHNGYYAHICIVDIFNSEHEHFLL